MSRQSSLTALKLPDKASEAQARNTMHRSVREVFAFTGTSAIGNHIPFTELILNSLGVLKTHTLNVGEGVGQGRVMGEREGQLVVEQQ